MNCSISEWHPIDKFNAAQSFSGVVYFWLAFSTLAHGLREFGPFEHDYRLSEAENYRRFKIRNLIISNAHSTISGIWALILLWSYPEAYFGINTVCYSSSMMHVLLMFVVGYFGYDAFEMLRYGRGKAMKELVAHHAVCTMMFGFVLMYRRFMPYACLTLLTEIHSMFMHWQSLNILDSPFHWKTVQLLNVLTLFTVRIGVNAWMLTYQLAFAAEELHVAYRCIGWFCTAALSVVNWRLVNRLLTVTIRYAEPAKPAPTAPGPEPLRSRAS